MPHELDEPDTRERAVFQQQPPYLPAQHHRLSKSLFVPGASVYVSLANNGLSAQAHYRGTTRPPNLGIDVEPAEEELLDMPIFDLNIAKLPQSTDVSALPTLAATADLTATTAQIIHFLKLMLDDISTLMPVPMD
uniref:Uncharacterized protein n=1 Tax=Romanomermis culicivorax TaxID=13658 RepID=A0A915L5L4_ROMCU